MPVQPSFAAGTDHGSAYMAVMSITMHPFCCYEQRPEQQMQLELESVASCQASKSSGSCAQGFKLSSSLIIQEYLQNGDTAEAARSLEELQQPAHQSQFVKQVLRHSHVQCASLALSAAMRSIAADQSCVSCSRKAGLAIAERYAPACTA